MEFDDVLRCKKYVFDKKNLFFSYSWSEMIHLINDSSRQSKNDYDDIKNNHSPY